MSEPEPVEQATVVVTADGRLRFVWDDALAALLDEGTPRIMRASHVEPTPDGRWQADLSPAGGPVLGPFRLRGEALAAERAWVERQLMECA